VTCQFPAISRASYPDPTQTSFQANTTALTVAVTGALPERRTENQKAEPELFAEHVF